MARLGRLWICLITAVTLVVVGCGRSPLTEGRPGDWRVLKAGSVTRAASDIPQDGAHLFQTESDLKTWTQRYGIDLPTQGVDFSKHTVAILVRRYSAFEPMVKAAEVTNKTARIVLVDDHTKPVSVPGLPAGFEVRQYVGLQLPKVEEITLIEEKPIP